MVYGMACSLIAILLEHLGKKVVVNLIGLWTVLTPQGDIKVFVLMCMDTTTNIIELTRIFEESSNHSAGSFEHAWLSWSPLNQCKSFMIMKDDSLTLFFNSC